MHCVVSVLELVGYLLACILGQFAYLFVGRKLIAEQWNICVLLLVLVRVQCLW